MIHAQIELLQPEEATYFLRDGSMKLVIGEIQRPEKREVGYGLWYGSRQTEGAEDQGILGEGVLGHHK